MVEFRRAQLGDAQQIVETRQKVWECTYRGIYPDNEIDCFDYTRHLNAEQRRLANPEFHCYLVLDDNFCVGYYSYGKVKAGMWKDFDFRLHSFYLLTAYQGVGLGRIIFERVKAARTKEGYSKMFLDCHPCNTKALGFYRHLGGFVSNVDSGHENPMEDSCTIEYYFT